MGWDKGLWPLFSPEKLGFGVNEWLELSDGLLGLNFGPDWGEYGFDWGENGLDWGVNVDWGLNGFLRNGLLTKEALCVKE